MIDEHVPAPFVPAAPGRPGHVEELNKPAEELPSSGGSWKRNPDGTLTQTTKPTLPAAGWKRDAKGELVPDHGPAAPTPKPEE